MLFHFCVKETTKTFAIISRRSWNKKKKEKKRFCGELNCEENILRMASKNLKAFVKVTNIFFLSYNMSGSKGRKTETKYFLGKYLLIHT